MKLIFAALTFLITLSAMATEFKLAVITSEFDRDSTDFFIDTNDAQEITSLRYIITTPTGQIKEDTSIPAQTVLTDGAVMAVRNGREVIRLKVDTATFNVKTGGPVRLTYLSSGVSNSWKYVPFKLVKEGEGFKLTDEEGSPVNKLFVKVNRHPIFGVIGIKAINYYFE